MNIIFSGKNFKPSRANKQFVEMKMNNLLTYDESIYQIRVELDADKKERDNAKFRVEAWVEGKRNVKAGAQGLTLQLAVDEVVSKLKRQLVKEKNKLETKRKRGGLRR